MKKISFIALLAISLVILFAGTYNPEDTKTTTVTVSGMHCDNCADKVQTALMQMKGVEKASVDLKAGMAEVEFNAEIVTIEDLKNVIIKTGYSIDSKSSESSCKEMKKASCDKEKKAGKASCTKKNKKSI